MPPPISLSAPELSSRCIMPFKTLRYAVSSTELLQERAVARFYKAVALEEERFKLKETTKAKPLEHNKIPKYRNEDGETFVFTSLAKIPENFIKNNSAEDKEYNCYSRQASQDTENTDSKYQMSFEEDYTASTVSTDGEFSELEDISLIGDLNRSDYTDELNTYNPKDKLARPLPAQKEVEEEELDRDERKPLPLSISNYPLKPILKRRESDVEEPKPSEYDSIPKIEEEVKSQDKPKKEKEKIILYKFTKMPVQRPFPFSKILHKRQLQPARHESISSEIERPKMTETKREEKRFDKISEEGRTVIDYYGNIVKEYGSQKMPTTPLYLKTEDLKAVAEKQKQENKDNKMYNKVITTKKTTSSKATPNNISNKKNPNAVKMLTKSDTVKKLDKSKLENKNKAMSKITDKQTYDKKKDIEQIVLQTTERAIIVIPIDYKELEEKAKTQKTDCMLYGPTNRVVDPKKCIPRDVGLVLGVYYNENMPPGDAAILTASAKKYDKKVHGKLWRLLKLSPIPKLGEFRIFFDLDPKFGYVCVCGLGSECMAYNNAERIDESKEAIRVAVGTACKALMLFNPRAIHLESFGNAECAAEGGLLGCWQFREYRKPDRIPASHIPSLHLYDDCDFEGWKIGKLKAESQNLARYLAEMPPNFLNPTSFAKIIVELLCELDINVEIRTKGWAAAHQMGGFVSIGKSSVQPPLYVEISYYGANECTRPVVLIGKGVTFDSGSLDLKPADELRYMKGDMAGAACVLAVTRAAAKLKLPVNIRGILPLCELMPSGKSPKYGDIVCSASGKSVCIRLPSREGRLLIADSLVYARNYWPKFVLDVGTMSKELMSTLGASACGCYSNSDELFSHLDAAASCTGDRIWRMPLWKFYEDRVLDVQSADVANTGCYRYGESPNCAAFLKQFVCDAKWVHLDTYNITYTKGHDCPYLGRGMTGRPTRTIIEMMYQLYAKSLV